MGHVRHLACDPSRAQQGVAARVLNQIVETARTCRVARLCCLSTRNAEPFYHRMGFETRAEVDLRLEPGLCLPALEMVRRV